MADSYKMLNTTDPKANYLCGSKGIENDIECKNKEPIIVDYTSFDRVDYMLKIEKDESEDKQKTLSYMSVNSIDEGIEWYRNNYPKIPEDLYPLMARWNWGDIGSMTKKEIKNDFKRVNKGKKPKQMILEKETPNFVIDFGSNK